MKKLVSALALSAVALSATSLSFQGGWNLKGAVEGLTPEQITCADTVWTYNSDGTWNLYRNGVTDVYTTYGLNPLTYIEQGAGFWVNATSSCSVDLSSTFVQPELMSYLAYGYLIQDRIRDERYTIDGNEIVFDETAKTFTLTAALSDGNDSRMGITLPSLYNGYPVAVLKTTLKLDTAGDNGRNRAQVNIGNLQLANTITNAKNASSGIIISPSGISYWFEIDYLDGTYDELLWEQTQTTSMVGKTIDVKVSVNGTVINYELSGDVTETYSIDTASYQVDGVSTDINSGIAWTELRARTDDQYQTATGDTSVVTISDIAAGMYLEGFDITDTTTATFSSALGNIFMVEPDENEIEYNSVVFSGSNFTYTSNAYNADTTSWEVDETFNGTISGDTVTVPDGTQVKFEIYHTAKVNSIGGIPFTDLYMHYARDIMVTAPTAYEYDTWDWANPTYYSVTTSQETAITDIDSLIAGFTSDTGMHFGGNQTPMFLVQDASQLPTRAGTVVLGYPTGTYENCTEGDCTIYSRTNSVVGTWEEGTGEILIETPQENISLSVVNNGGTYYIQSGYMDKVGAMFHDIIFTGSDATEANIKAVLEAQAQ